MRVPVLVLAAGLSAAIPQIRQAAPREAAAVTVLRPARVFDGESMHEG